jgi:tRNA(Ile)-lysidine synthase
MAENGKILDSANYTFIKDNDCIYIEKVKESIEPILVHKPGSFSILKKSIDVQISNQTNQEFNENEFHIDSASVQFPLTIRALTNEDKFQPLGMNGRKSISKFLKDKGVNQIKRKSTLLIEDVNGVILVLGHQIDDTRKISSNTNEVLTFKIVNSIS